MYRTSPKTSEPIANVNARFLEHLEDTRPQNAGKRRAAWFGFVSGIALLIGALAATLLTRDFLLTWPLLPVGATLAIRGWRSLKRLHAVEQRFTNLLTMGMRGVPVTGYLVQANEALFQPGSETALPALVLFSFQPEVDGDAAYMSSLARRVYRLKNTAAPENTDNHYVAALTTNEQAVPHRRRALPFSFTDGSTIYCADLWIQRSDLRGGCLTANQLPCLAEPGESGGIELVPAFLLPSPPPLTRLDRRPV